MREIKICPIHGTERKRLPGSKGNYCVACTADRCKKWYSNMPSHSVRNRPYHAIYYGIKQRCYNRKNKKYFEYGGRGIEMCDRWLETYDNFQEDMGLRPTLAHSIERQDVNGNYDPDNCKWATTEEQNRNTRRSIFVEIDDERIHLVDAAFKLGISYDEAWRKFRGNISLDENHLVSSKGKKITLAELSNETGISLDVIIYRASRGAKVEWITSSHRAVPTYLHEGCHYTEYELFRFFGIDVSPD